MLVYKLFWAGKLNYGWTVVDLALLQSVVRNGGWGDIMVLHQHKIKCAAQKEFERMPFIQKNW